MVCVSSAAGELLGFLAPTLSSARCNALHSALLAQLPHEAIHRADAAAGERAGTAVCSICLVYALGCVTAAMLHAEGGNPSAIDLAATRESLGALQQAQWPQLAVAARDALSLVAAAAGELV